MGTASDGVECSGDVSISIGAGLGGYRCTLRWCLALKLLSRTYPKLLLALGGLVSCVPQGSGALESVATVAAQRRSRERPGPEERVRLFRSPNTADYPRAEEFRLEPVSFEHWTL